MPFLAIMSKAIYKKIIAQHGVLSVGTRSPFYNMIYNMYRGVTHQ